MKYKTYKELFSAYASGEIPKTAKFFYDGDCSFVFIATPTKEDPEHETEVFRGNGDCDFVEVLEAFGIPVEVA